MFFCDDFIFTQLPTNRMRSFIHSFIFVASSHNMNKVTSCEFVQMWFYYKINDLFTEMMSRLSYSQALCEPKSLDGYLEKVVGLH